MGHFLGDEMSSTVRWILVAALAWGCAKSEDGAAGTADTGTPEDPGGGGGPDIDCTPVIPETFGAGGCRITLVSPANCDTISFPRGGAVEFAWTTDTTFCEGPHHFVMGGHPVETWYQDNGFVLDLSSTDGEFRALGDNGSSYAMTRNIGGVVRLVEADLAGITTTTGQYHFAVQDFYDLSNGGSISESHTFLVR